MMDSIHITLPLPIFRPLLPLSLPYCPSLNFVNTPSTALTPVLTTECFSHHPHIQMVPTLTPFRSMLPFLLIRRVFLRHIIWYSLPLFFTPSCLRSTYPHKLRRYQNLQFTFSAARLNLQESKELLLYEWMNGWMDKHLFILSSGTGNFSRERIVKQTSEQTQEPYLISPNTQSININCILYQIIN